ncbi:MAG: hypothetical protein R6V83_14015 [Candidatus Thorarchaeota archaeon]
MIGQDEFLDIINRFISDRKAVYADIKEDKELGEYFIASLFGTIIFSAIYGLVMGVYAGGIQILYDALKIPMLLLISLYVSLPTFYVLNGILGGDMTFRQIVVLFMVSVTTMSTMLVAFMPVTLFFTITTPERGFASYTFTVLLNVMFFAVAGLTAVVYLLSGFSHIHGENKRWILAVLIGSCVLAFVGTQLAWVLRPYFHMSWKFIRPPSGNFYVAILELLLRYL